MFWTCENGPSNVVMPNGNSLGLTIGTKYYSFCLLGAKRPVLWRTSSLRFLVVFVKGPYCPPWTAPISLLPSYLGTIRQTTFNFHLQRLTHFIDFVFLLWSDIWIKMTKPPLYRSSGSEQNANGGSNEQPNSKQKDRFIPHNSRYKKTVNIH